VRAWPKFLVISELRALIREFRPQIVVAHGYSDHLWGRIAALRENVPVVVQVEHNLEHYKWLHLWRSRRLAARTDAIVTVSRGVAKRLEDCGIPADKLRPILNGVRTERFSAAGAEPWEKREPAVLMAARFARQKDHATLLHAVAELRRRGVVVPVRLAGGGSSGHQRTARRLAESLGLEGVVEFLGPRSDLPELYRKHRVAALSTRYEGLSLAVIEALVAGCAVVGSRVPGVEELIDGGRTGWLAAPQDPVALADAIQEALGPEGAVRAGAGRTAALAHYSLQRTIDEYEALFEELINRRRIAVTR
jgi:glycosyltransferase involved in cell wall biosynthesis